MNGKPLTPREEEMVRFVAAGLSNKQIAFQTNMSVGTVKFHLHNAYQKLGLTDRSTFSFVP
jgi:LuxR family maltose regulon positive regulatory protein